MRQVRSYIQDITIFQKPDSLFYFILFLFSYIDTTKNNNKKVIISKYSRDLVAKINHSISQYSFNEDGPKNIHET